MAVVQVNKENFNQEVMQSERKVLLDFWAPWCGPCRMVGPILDEIAAERPDVKVCKVNVDEQADLANQFRIMSIPTLMVVDGGEIRKQAAGARSKAGILDML